VRAIQVHVGYGRPYRNTMRYTQAQISDLVLAKWGSLAFNNGEKIAQKDVS